MNIFKKFLRFVGKKIIKRKSIYFLSFNKCATTLFNDIVLDNLIFHEKIDYTSMIYSDIKCDIKFETYGNAYGIIKVGSESGSLYEMINSTVLSPNFIKDKIVIFLIRDPRDILVSEYYSYGFTHGFSDNTDIRKFQEGRQMEIRSLTLDEYVLKNSSRINDDFMRLSNIAKSCNCWKVFKYEDLVNDYNNFIRKLNVILPMRKKAIDCLYSESRPSNIEDLSSHKRSGKVYGFVDKLSPDTVEKVNKILARSLEEFDYPVTSK